MGCHFLWNKANMNWVDYGSDDAFRLFSAKPLYEPMVVYSEVDSRYQTTTGISQQSHFQNVAC